MAVCLALGMVLPFVTGAIPEVGNLISPMHIPVFICAALLGPVSGGIVGAVMPLLRFVLFGSPAFFPRGVNMAVELCAYGIIFGLLIKYLPKKLPFYYVALVVAMIGGRLMGGAAKLVLLASGVIGSYSLELFFAGYFVESWLGIIVQLVLIPPLLMTLRRLEFLKGLNL
jgi:uncharacterized membrane protein